MAYADQKQNRGVAIGSVVLVHAALGVGLLSGLVVTVTGEPKDPPIKIVDISAEPTPPPVPEPEPLPKRAEPRPSAPDTITVPIARVDTNTASSFPTTTIEYPPLPPHRPRRSRGPMSNRPRRRSVWRGGCGRAATRALGSRRTAIRPPRGARARRGASACRSMSARTARWSPAA